MFCFKGQDENYSDCPQKAKERRIWLYPYNIALKMRVYKLRWFSYRQLQASQMDLSFSANEMVTGSVNNGICEMKIFTFRTTITVTMTSHESP